MSQTTETSMKAFAAIIIADIFFGVLIFFATWINLGEPVMDSLLFTFVTEILMIEVQSIFFPAVSLWSARKLIARGSDKVLARGEKLRNEADNRIYGVWCYSGHAYPKLTDYFRTEKKLMDKGVEIHRLINVKEVGEHKAKKHCEEFKDEIVSGKYIITSVGYHSREVLIVDRKKALILYQNLCAKDVAGGIGPYDDPNWVAGYADEYEELESAGNTLVIDPSNAEESIADWVTRAMKDAATMTCIKCGTRHLQQAHFCGNCGMKLT